MEKFIKLVDDARKELTEGNYLNSLHLLLECKDLRPDVSDTYFLLHQLDLLSGTLSLNQPIEAKTNKSTRRQLCNSLKIEQVIGLCKSRYSASIHEKSILEPAIFMNGYANIQNAYCQSHIELGNRVYIGHQ